MCLLRSTQATKIYFNRFFEEYSNLANITFWGMTIENEPQYGLDPWYKFQAMWVSPETQR